MRNHAVGPSSLKYIFILPLMLLTLTIKVVGEDISETLLNDTDLSALKSFYKRAYERDAFAFLGTDLYAYQGGQLDEIVKSGRKWQPHADSRKADGNFKQLTKTDSFYLLNRSLETLPRSI